MSPLPFVVIFYRSSSSGFQICGQFVITSYLSQQLAESWLPPCYRQQLLNCQKCASEDYILRILSMQTTFNYNMRICKHGSSREFKLDQKIRSPPSKSSGLPRSSQLMMLSLSSMVTQSHRGRRRGHCTNRHSFQPGGCGRKTAENMQQNMTLFVW